MAAEEVQKAGEFAVNWRRIVYCVPWTTAILLAFALGAQSLVVWYWVEPAIAAAPAILSVGLSLKLGNGETSKREHPNRMAIEDRSR